MWRRVKMVMIKRKMEVKRRRGVMNVRGIVVENKSSGRGGRVRHESMRSTNSCRLASTSGDDQAHTDTRLYLT